MIPIITIEGPTASGKSDLALKLALELNTEIISADSRQVYKYLDIGTAKPSKEVQNMVKHHLIDIITPDQHYNAGSFLREASVICRHLHSLGKTPIVCGGSMLYIKCLLEGISEIPEIPEDANEKTKDFMLEKSLEECYAFVKKIDPIFASNISSSDKQRITRVLNVWFAFNKNLTEYWSSGKSQPEFIAHRIYVNRDRTELYHRINKRLNDMINQGLLDEIDFLLKKGYSKDDYGLNTVGYKEFLCEDNLDTAIELAAQHTRNYAKRQITWYRKINFDEIRGG